MREEEFLIIMKKLMNNDYVCYRELRKNAKNEKNPPKLTKMEVQTNFEHLKLTVKYFLTLAGWQNLLRICLGTKY